MTWLSSNETLSPERRRKLSLKDRKGEGALVRGADLARERNAFATRRARGGGESAHARVEAGCARDTQPNARRNPAHQPDRPKNRLPIGPNSHPSLTKLFVLRDPVAEQPLDPLLPRFNALIVSSPRSKCGVKKANSWSKQTGLRTRKNCEELLETSFDDSSNFLTGRTKDSWCISVEIDSSDLINRFLDFTRRKFHKCWTKKVTFLAEGKCETFDKIAQSWIIFFKYLCFFESVVYIRN